MLLMRVRLQVIKGIVIVQTRLDAFNADFFAFVRRYHGIASITEGQMPVGFND